MIRVALALAGHLHGGHGAAVRQTRQRLQRGLDQPVALFAVHMGQQGEAAIVAEVADGVVEPVGNCGHCGSLKKIGDKNTRAGALHPPIQSSETTNIVEFNILNR